MTVIEKADLTECTSFRVPAFGQRLITVHSVADVAEACAAYPNAKILGGGSNILITGNVDVPIIQIAIPGYQHIHETNTTILIRVGAGESWHEFVSYSVEHNLGGVENLALIPGTVGAAPIQNIGAYGVEQDSVCEEVEAYDRIENTMVRLHRTECGFGYRTSRFKSADAGRYVVCSVVYRLTKPPYSTNTTYKDVAEALRKTPNPSIQEVYNAVVAIRKRKLPDPHVLGNAGSFFKNPVIGRDMYERLNETYPTMPVYPVNEHTVKVAAAWLIDQCGFKGYRDADAGVHVHQALVLVNYGRATGSDILRLASRIQQSVRERFGISLEPEVNIW